MQDLSFGDNPPKDWQKTKTNTRRVAKRAGITTPLKDIAVLLTDLIVDSIAKALQTQAGNGKGNGRGNGKGSGKGNDRGNGKGNGKGNDRVQDNDNGHGNGNGRDNGRGTAGTVHKAPENVRWKNPANRTLKLAMQMLESDDSDVNESHLYVSLLSHSHALPPTCTILSATHLQIAQALPDTQAAITVTNDEAHVTKMHHETRTLHGIVGNASVVAHLADLAIPLQTEQGSRYHLVVRRNPRCPGGLYSPDASSIVLAHEDLEAAGMRVDYDAGRISLPNKDTINMDKTARTWRIKLASPDAQVNISKDQHPHVALQDAIWMGLSPSSLLKVYEHYNGAWLPLTRSLIV